MRKLFLKVSAVLPLSILIASCSIIQSDSNMGAGHSSKMLNRNEACYESTKLRVFQVLDDGILAHLCPVEFPSYYENSFEACIMKGDVVYMSVPKEKNFFVDDQKITLPDELCFAPNGTFRYQAKNDQVKTVRMITIIDSNQKAE